MSALSIGTMSAPELGLALDWAAREGWNPGLRDAFCFATVDPGGLFVAALDGEPVGSITVVNYDADFAFLGFYIVRPEFRGRGFGTALWRAGMAHRGTRLVGLDGVPEQQANYRKSGFRYAWRNQRYAGPVAAVTSPATVTPLDHRHLDEVAALDREVFPAARTGFLEAWLTAEGHVALGHVSAGRLDGFGVLRPCREGAKIGPLVAPTRTVAEALFDGLAARAATGPLVIDVPDVNPEAVALAEARGMAPVFETARMYTGPAPALARGKIFAVTTFELG